jgi:hypothetical protein
MSTEPKSAWASTTIWAGVAQIGLGIAMLAVGVLLSDQHGDLVPAGIAMLSTGVATIRGRVIATRPVKF